jgi:hypothetical protein
MHGESDSHPLVQGHSVDVDALIGLAHHCQPFLCRDSGSCCVAYDVWLGDEERRRILEVAPAAATYLPGGSVPEAAVRQWGPDAHALAKDEAGRCALAYRDGEGRVLCSLHSAALDLGLAPEEVKPESCVLWPLSVTSSRPPVLSVQEGALRYPCNRRRRACGLDEGVAGILQQVLGEEFLAEVERLVATEQDSWT